MIDEIREKVLEFKQREERLLMDIKERPLDQNTRNELKKLIQERQKWLFELGGASDEMSMKEIEKLNLLVTAAEKELSSAAASFVALSEFNATAAKSPQPNYEITLEKKSKHADFSELSALNKINAIVCFDKRRRQKSFVKAKIGEIRRKIKSAYKDNGSQGPSQE